MFKQLERRLFVLRTRLRVEQSNFSATRAFSSAWDAWQIAVKPMAAAVAALFIFGAVAGAAYFNRGPVTAEFAVVNSLPQPAIIPVPEPEPAVLIDADRAMPRTYSIAVDKYNSRLYVLEERADYWEVVEDYEISLGQILGVKQREGDLRTPVGYYRIVEVKGDEELPAIYGPRAFVLNYPNSFDMALGRTGGGIWLHGSGLGERTPDTRGCVELNDDNIIALDRWIGIDTTVAIFPKDFPVPVVNGRIEKRLISTRFFYGDLTDFNAG